jgi:hypothetical protein
MRLLREHAPFLAATVFFLAIVSFLLAGALRKCDGRLVYALDDAYIHMSMARHAVEQGVWGISERGFASATSSPLWTAALAGVFAVTGPVNAVPFILNLLLGTLVLAAAWAALRAAGLRGVRAFLALAALALAVPLHTLAFLGMEHLLHILIAIVFCSLTAAALAGEEETRARRATWLGLAALLVLARYESLFLIAPAAALFAWQRRWLRAGALLAASLMPPAAYGALCLAKGWYAIPNSVLLKGNMPEFSAAGLANLMARCATELLRINTCILPLFAAGLILFILRYDARAPFGRRSSGLIAIFTGAALLHSAFASAQPLGFFRYEAYLIVLGLTAVISAAAGAASETGMDRRSAPRAAAAALLAAVCILPFAMRAWNAAHYIPIAARNIYEQHGRMARFLRTQYAGRTVAIHDIGFATWEADIDCVDLYGLADMEVARARRAGAYGAEAIESICRRRGVSIVIVYDKWMTNWGGVPRAWSREDVWTIDDNAVCGSDRLSFYAARPEEREELVRKLRAFDLLPAVAAAGEYTE